MKSKISKRDIGNTDQRDLREEIKKRLFNKDRELNSLVPRDAYKYLSILFSLFAGLQIGFITIQKDFRLTAETLESIFRVLFLLFFALATHILSQKPPDKDREEWLWKNGKKLHQALFAGSFFLALIPIVSTSDFFSFSYLLLAFLFFALSIMRVYATWKPSIILNSNYTETASSLIRISPYIIFIILLEKVVPINSTTLPILLATFSIGLYYSYKILKKESKLNIFQRSVLSFVRPEIILIEFAKHDDIIKNEIEALEIIDKLSKEEKFVVEYFLMQHLTEKYSTTKPVFIKILIAVSTFILLAIASSIIDSITGDTFYNTILRDWVCKFLPCQ